MPEIQEGLAGHDSRIVNQDWHLEHYSWLKKPQVMIFKKSGKKEVISYLTQFFSGYISSFSDLFPKNSVISVNDKMVR
jgi:hypothetical protein